MRAEPPRGTKALSPKKVQKELDKLHEAERDRLAGLAREGAPAGDYASPVFGTGSLNPRVMFVGEAPGRTEAKLGRGFVGRAGKLFDHLLEIAGIPREETFITNTVRFRPMDPKRSNKNRKPKLGEIKDALPVLEGEIVLVRPPVIMALGGTSLNAVQMLAGLPQQAVGTVRGEYRTVRVGGHEAVLTATFHPASVLYKRSNGPLLEAKALGEFLKEAEQ